MKSATTNHRHVSQCIRNDKLIRPQTTGDGHDGAWSSGGQRWGRQYPNNAAPFVKVQPASVVAEEGTIFIFSRQCITTTSGSRLFLVFFSFKFGFTSIIIKFYGPDWHHGTSGYWCKAKWSLMYTTYNIERTQARARGNARSRGK